MRKTKTQLNAQNYSNDASQLTYNGIIPNIIMGDSIMGSPDIDDVYLPNIQSVENIIQDIMSASIGSIGDIIIKNDKTDPSGFAQLDKWTFINTEGFIYSEDTYINILGKRVLMTEGMDITNIVVETQRVIQEYIEDGLYFRKVEVLNDLEMEVEYADRRIHNPVIVYDDPRVEITKTIIRPMVPGYGKWTFIGSEQKTFGEINQDFFYYRRIG